MADDDQATGRLFDDRVYDELKPERGFSIRRCLLSVGRALKHIVLFCLSQFGLIAIVVFYSIIGAWVFSQLERPNEEAMCFRNADLYNLAETSMVYRMWEVVTAYQQPADFQEATGQLALDIDIDLDFRETIGQLELDLDIDLDFQEATEEVQELLNEFKDTASTLKPVSVVLRAKGRIAYATSRILLRISTTRWIFFILYI